MTGFEISGPCTVTFGGGLDQLKMDLFCLGMGGNACAGRSCVPSTIASLILGANAISLVPLEPRYPGPFSDPDRSCSFDPVSPVAVSPPSFERPRVLP